MGKESVEKKTQWDAADIPKKSVYNDCSFPLVLKIDKDLNERRLSLNRDHVPLIITPVSTKEELEECSQCSSPSPVVKGPPQPKKGCRRFLGVFLALLSSICFSLAILIVKYLSNYHPFSFGVWRFIGILLPSIPILIVDKVRSNTNGKKIFGSIWPLTKPSKRKTLALLILRCICGTGAIVLQYCSIQHMDIADSTVIVFSTPCFVTLFAWIILGEACGIVPILSAILSLIGVIVVCRPPVLKGQSFHRDLLIGIGLAMASMLCATTVFIVLRSLRKVHIGVITGVFGFIGVLQCSILSAIIHRFDIPSNGWQCFLVFNVALLSFLGQAFITCALKYEQAGVISLMRSFDVIFAFIWQYIFLNVYPDLYSFLGASIVILSVCLIGTRKWVAALSKDHPYRKSLWFLLI